MSKIRIVLTVDYEIFGNGTGDVRWCLIEPTKKILEIGDKYNIPITWMAELCEYWAFKKEERKGSLPSGYTPARWIEEQLIRCIETGHDVQLHIHPQWINYAYLSTEKKWKVDLNYWKVSSLSYEEIYRILREGKQELERLLKPFKPDYECFVFRAGACCIQPEKHILKALMDAGLKVDTTVSPNLCFEDKLTYCDFRGIPQQPFWFVRESLKEEAAIGILEIPICTKRYSFYDKVYRELSRKIKHAEDSPENCNGYVEMAPKRFSKKFLPEYYRLDICEMSDREMMVILKDAEARFGDYDLIPVVATGHSKLFNNSNNLESFIKKALDKG
nr:hypothetical protein [Desulfobacterales bacterium]